MEEFIELMKSRRSIRWFGRKPVPYELLVQMVDCARLAPYGANLQPMKYKIVNDPDTVKAIYPHTKWAGYIPDRKPTAEDAPTAFIALLGDTDIKKEFGCDCGIAGMSMLLAAQAQGLASCWIGAFDKEKAAQILNIDKRYELCYLIGVGYAAQKSSVCEFKGDVKYTMDAEGNVHVPKRSLAEVIIK